MKFKKFILKNGFFVIILQMLNLSAQNNNHIKKFELGFNVSPEISYRILKNNNEASKNELNYRENEETLKFGYTSGINFVYNLNSIWGIETGLQYSDKGYNIKRVTDTLYTSHKNFIDIPLKINLTLGNKKVKFFSSTGVVTNVFLNQKNVITYKKQDSNVPVSEKLKNIQENKKINFSAILSIGVLYKINSSMSLRAEPTMRYALLNNNTSEIISEHLWNLGLNIGWYIAL